MIEWEVGYYYDKCVIQVILFLLFTHNSLVDHWLLISCFTDYHDFALWPEKT